MCPPGVDQTTRGPQRWCLLLPLLQQKISLVDTHHTRDAQEWLANNEQTFNAFGKLARITPPDLEIPTLSPRPLSALESLPPEITSMILSTKQLSKNDILSFAACSQTTWIQSLAYIRTQVRNATGSLARTPLVCIGTYLTDLPPELHKLYPEVQKEDVAWAARGRWGRCPARYWRAAKEAGSVDLRDSDPLAEWRCALLALASGRAYLACRISEMERVLLKTSIQLDRTWTLKNLTTQETFALHHSTNDEGQSIVHVTGAPWLTLDMALLMRTCWTKANSYESWRGLHHVDGSIWPNAGQWAGHSFEIVKGEVEAWTDVTQSVIAEAEKIGIFGCPKDGHSTHKPPPAHRIVSEPIPNPFGNMDKDGIEKTMRAAGIKIEEIRQRMARQKEGTAVEQQREVAASAAIS